MQYMILHAYTFGAHYETLQRIIAFPAICGDITTAAWQIIN